MNAGFDTRRVVVVGGGFAGVMCARTLHRAEPRLEVVLFSRDNHMVFQPLLPDVAGSSLNPRAVAPPLRQLLPGVRCRTQEISAIDLPRRELEYADHDGQQRRMRYDQLVLACGNAVNLNLLPGMANHALPLKTIGDAIAMRARVMQQLEKADLAEVGQARRFLLSFIVVGGGFSGVEVAGEINDLIRSVRHRYPGIGADEACVTLVHGLPQILPEVGSGLRDFAQRRMTRRGIRVLCNVRVAEVSARGVRLADGTGIEGATVMCTVGTTAHGLIARLDVPKERGRIVASPDMRVPGHDELWAIGDCALVTNAHDGRPAPPTAQFAERQGRQCALNIVAALAGRETRPFNYRPVGTACGIGGREGVAELFGMRFSGFVAWWLWRSAFLAKIPSLAQKLKVGFDWAWELVFARDLSHFRTAQSDPVAQVHFAPGEVLFQSDRPVGQLWSLERGQVEIVQQHGDGGIEQLGTLGAGSVLGAATLAGFTDAPVEVRAVGPVDAWVLGEDSLRRLSSALAPVEAIITRAVTVPARSIWRHHKAAMSALADRKAAELPTSMPLIVLPVDAPLRDAFDALIETRAGCVAVVDGGRLVGLATRTDLLGALARGADRSTALRVAMNAAPTALDSDESAARAAEVMAEGGLKFLPLTDREARPVAMLCSDDFVRLALALER